MIPAPARPVLLRNATPAGVPASRWKLAWEQALDAIPQGALPAALARAAFATRAAGAPEAEARTVLLEALAAEAAGDAVDAGQRAHRALSLVPEAAASPAFRALAHAVCASTHVALADAPGARPHVDAARAVLAATPDVAPSVAARLAPLLAARGEVSPAEDLLQAAIAALPDGPRRTAVRLALAQIRTEDGRPDAALPVLVAALNACRVGPACLARIQTALGAAHAGAGRDGLAHHHLRAALELHEAQSEPAAAGDVHLAIARLHASAGEREEAIAAIDAALSAVGATSGHPVARAASHLAYRVYKSAGDLPRALAALEAWVADEEIHTRGLLRARAAFACPLPAADALAPAPRADDPFDADPTVESLW